jgi:hypothetical protein
LLLGFIVSALVEAACDPPANPITLRQVVTVATILGAMALSMLLLG